MEQNVLDSMYEQLGISKEVLDYAADIEKSLKERFERIDQTAEYNQLKVLKGMQDNKVSDIHFAATTGYGYNDIGRDTLEDVYASVFHAESSTCLAVSQRKPSTPKSRTHSASQSER